MPDGAGYVVLDKLGGVNEVRQRAAGRRRRRHRPRYWGVDLGRDIVIVSGFGAAFGYYVLDAWGDVVGTSGSRPRTNPAATLFRDRWRGIAIYGGKPLLLRNDGSTQLTN